MFADDVNLNSSHYLRELVSKFHQCKSSVEEKNLVARETCVIRKIFREEKKDLRAIAVLKLLYFYTIGYPAHMAQVECLKLVASGRFSDKRIGYLGSMTLLDESTDMHVLITNSLTLDLGSPNKHIKSIALCAFATLCSADMAHVLAPHVEVLLRDRSDFIRCKAALVAVRVIDRVPDLTEMYLSFLDQIVQESKLSLKTSLITLAIKICELRPEVAGHLNKINLHVHLCKQLIAVARKTHEIDYNVSGINNPFLQIRVLRLLALMARVSEEVATKISGTLVQMVTHTDSSNIPGCAIIYQTTLTIAECCRWPNSTSEHMCRLAINAMGSFLRNNNKNIKYVALNVLFNMAQKNLSEVAKLKKVIYSIVIDNDEAIKKRAIELSFFISDEHDRKKLINILLSNIVGYSMEMQQYASEFIISSLRLEEQGHMYVMEKFLEILQLPFSQCVKREDIMLKFIFILTNADDDMKVKAVRLLYELLVSFRLSELSVQLACWSIGEYSDLLLKHGLTDEHYLNKTDDKNNKDSATLVEVLRRYFYDTTLSWVTRNFVLYALIKLSVRVPQLKQSINNILEFSERTIDVECQQRINEYFKLTEKYPVNLRSLMFGRMPKFDDVYKNSQSEFYGGENNENNNNNNKSETFKENSYIEQISDKKAANETEDLLVFASMEKMNESALAVTVEVRMKDAAQTVNNLIMQFAVTKQYSIVPTPADGDTLMDTVDSVRQKIIVKTVSANEDETLKLRVKLRYSRGGQPTCERMLDLVLPKN